jgi:hypothetical protein
VGYLGGNFMGLVKVGGGGGGPSLSVDFTADDTNPAPNDVVTFTATGHVGSGYLHVWDFGDGSDPVVVEDSATTTHTYTTEQVVDVELWVIRVSDDALGNRLREAYIDVENVFAFGNSLVFDGINDFVSIPAIATPTDLTISTWIVPQEDDILPIIGNSDDSGRYIRIQSSNNRILIQDGSGLRIFNFPSIVEDVAIHLFIAIDGTAQEGRCWINGVESSSGTITARTDALTMNSIGNRNDSTYGEMKLNELAMWFSVVGTAQNASDLYNSGNGQLASLVIADPDRYYRFNGSGTDTTATDDGTEGADGTLNNFTGTYWVAW